MKVVLDSNIIIADFWLESTNFEVLFASAKKGDIEIFIPEIVLDEVINKYDQRLQQSQQKVDSELKTFRKLSKLSKKNPLTKSTIDESVSDYNKHIKKVIKENSIIVLKYPKTSHRFLAHKAMNKLKPFNTNEKGYRDCLIWENIKTLLTDSESAVTVPELVFISNNYKDFTTTEYELHPDLISELEDEDFDTNSVIVYPKLSEFNDKQAKLFFAQSKSFGKKLKNNGLWDFDLQTEVTNYLFENYVGSELFQYDVDFTYEYSDPTVSSIYEDFDIEITSVKKLNAKEYLVDISFEVETVIDFFIDKSEYWSIEDDKHISIEDSDWNEWVMWASTEITVPLTMSLIIDSELNVKSSQINTINKNYAQQWL